MSARECRDAGAHQYDDPMSRRATCQRCGVVRRVVFVPARWSGLRRMRKQVRVTYEYGGATVTETKTL